MLYVIWNAVRRYDKINATPKFDVAFIDYLILGKLKDWLVVVWGIKNRAYRYFIAAALKEQ